MTRFIYRKSGDSNIYDASTNQRISASDFGNGAGFQELKAIDGAKYNTKDLQTANYDNITPVGNTLYGLQKQGATQPTTTPTPSVPSNQLNASTLSTGLKAGNVASKLPSSNVQAQQVYSQNLLSDSQNNAQKLQEQYNNIQAKQLQETSTNLKQAQTDLSSIQSDKQAQATSYDQTMNPINEKIKTQYNSMVDSLSQYDYNSLVKQKIDLTNNITEYAKMMNDELNSNAANTSFSSIMQGRSATIKDNYTSKIATAQAAMSAIDGNFTLAEDIMSKASTAIQSTLTNRISFLQSVNTLYATKESDAKTKVDTLTTEQKTLIDKASSDLKTKIDAINKSKEAIMKLMQDNPIVAQKAGLTLTDTEEQRATKLQNFYNKNPQYTPDNQAIIKAAMQKYFDAGITLNDSLETVKSKVMMSKIYEKDTAGKFTMTTDPNTGQPIVFNSTDGSVHSGATDLTNGIVGGYNISSYATDPSHEQKVANILSGIGKFNTVQDIDSYIKSKYPNSPISGQMIAEASQKYGVSWEMLVAMMEQDSSLGTKGKGARTFNPGNVGNDDSGNIVNYGNWQSGVDAVGNWLGKHKATTNTSVNENAASWAKLIAEGKAKINEVPDKMRQSVINEMANNGSVSKTDAKATQEIQDKISLIDDIIKGANNSGAIGPNALARTSLTSWITGTRQALVGKIKQLTSQETLDKLINLKKSGGTLGALSDQERLMLQSSATKIGAWEMKDKNGVGTGFYNVSESDFIKELNNIKTITQKALESASDKGGLVNSLEQNLASNPAKIDEYNTLVKDNPSLSEDEINQLLGF